MKLRWSIRVVAPALASWTRKNGLPRPISSAAQNFESLPGYREMRLQRSAADLPAASGAFTGTGRGVLRPMRLVTKPASAARPPSGRAVCVIEGSL